MAETLESGRRIEVDEDVLRAWIPILEREGYAIEVSRRYTNRGGDTWNVRRQTAPRTPSEQRFIAGLREVARAIGYALDLSVR